MIGYTTAIWCFTVDNLGAIGLALDIVGVWLLFGSELVNDLLIGAWDGGKDEHKKRKKVLSWIGVLLLTVGFLLQIIANYT